MYEKLNSKARSLMIVSEIISCAIAHGCYFCGMVFYKRY